MKKIKRYIGFLLLSIAYMIAGFSVILLADYKTEYLNLFLVCMFVIFPISYIGGCKFLNLK